MRLDIDVAGEISAEEASMIERARNALLYENRVFRGQSPQGYPYNDVACAVVWPRHGKNPMRIEFKAVPVEGVGQAYLGPDIPLTEELFDGNSFTEAFKQKMKAAFDAYDEYLSPK